jgi:hypothetical protein
MGKGGGGGGVAAAPEPAAIPKEAEALASKRDVEALEGRKRGRKASQVIDPGLLLTAPKLLDQNLKEKLG